MHNNNQVCTSSGSNISLLNEEEMNSIIGDGNASKKKQLNKYDISRVVVLHNNILETYMEDIMFSASSKGLTKPDGEETCFDNDSFWSGSITWY